jgi:hypothetical protein
MRPLSCRLSRVALVFVAMGLLRSTGCGPHSDRLEITGAITLDGAPLDGGSIRLSCTGGEKLIASGAMIQNGQFAIPQEKGLPPGIYQVEISAPDNDAPLIMYRSEAGGPSMRTQPERIPPEYNVNSKQTIEVTADGENHFVFDIATKTR